MTQTELNDILDSTPHSIDLSGADLSNLDLSYANLNGANLRGASLHKACLAGAQLHRVDFRGADLTYSDWTDTEIVKCNFDNSYRTGAYHWNDDATVQYAHAEWELNQ